MARLSLNIHDRLALEEMAKLASLDLRNLPSLGDQERQNSLRENLSLVRGTLGRVVIILKMVFLSSWANFVNYSMPTERGCILRMKTIL